MVSFEELAHPKHLATLVIDTRTISAIPRGGQAKRGMDISAMAAVVPDIINLIEKGQKAGGLYSG